MSTTYCYDGADRILNDSAGNAYSYDKHGNTTKVTSAATGDVTIFVYDSDDRHVKTITPSGAGGTATVTYTRDATDRITTRAVVGSANASENGAASYGYSASGDSPDLYLGGSGAIGQRVLVLDAGATYTKDYTDPAKSMWAYPNIHGDITTSTGSGGAAAGPIVCYDPYGTPITTTGAVDADGAPNTAPGAFDAGWLGQHQRYTEHTAALNYVQMGQRVYNPTTGRFMQPDPIEGGGANDYSYPTDPVNMYDLDGDLWFIPVLVGFAARYAVKQVVKYAAKQVVKKTVKKAGSAAYSAGKSAVTSRAVGTQNRWIGNKGLLNPIKTSRFGGKLNGNRLGWSYNAPGNRAAFGLGLRGQPHRKAWFTTPYRWGSVKNGPK